MSYIKNIENQTISPSKFFRPMDTHFKVNGYIITCVITYRPIWSAKVLLRMCGIEPDLVTFVGIAKCSPNDVFDETIGKDVAEHKALKCYYQFLTDIFSKMHKYFGQATDCAWNFKQWASYKADKQKVLSKKY